MGSFNIACSISNLTVHEGDEIGLMFIRRQPTYGPPQALAHRIYNTDDFLPYLAPVFGVYDDYGRLADLKPSATTKVIEEIFERPAVSVVNAIGSDRGIYDYCNPICELYMPEHLFKLLQNYGKTDEQVFKAFGLTKVPAQDGYLEAWQFEDWRVQSREYEFHGVKEVGHSIFTWDIDNAKTGKVVTTNVIAANGVSVVLSTLARATGFHPGFPEEDWVRIDRLQSMSGSFFLKEVYDQFKERALADPYDGKWTEKTEDELKQILATILVYREGVEIYKGTDLDTVLTHTYFYRSLAIKTEWEFWALRHYLEGEELRDALIYPMVLQLCNRMLAPSYNGQQDGNDRDAWFLNRVTDKILEARKVRFGSYEDDDLEGDDE